MTTTIFGTEGLVRVKEKVLNWIQRFSTFSFLDNHNYSSGLTTQELLAGAGTKFVHQHNTARGHAAITALNDFVQLHKGEWIFGHLGYDFGSASLQVPDVMQARKGFGDVCFFVPEVVIRLAGQTMEITATHPGQIFQSVIDTEELPPGDDAALTEEPKISKPLHSFHITKPVIQSRLNRETYITTIRRLQEHILRGDCYEINFCQEFYADNARIDPVAAYKKLAMLSPAPFAALYRVDAQWLACSSPERYIKKTGNRIYSQPIKGTAKRDEANALNDEQEARRLYHSAKDRSENVMIVDLVRNDFSRFCREGTVQVDELYGIYIFPQVYQMISTISGELESNTSFGEIIEASFPMGSMTGAPKKRVMELISKYEQGSRGLFSGTIGYITPEGDFDFNVVIRSILYDADAGYLSLPAGSGITFYSDPALEWEECLTKAAAMRRVFDQDEAGE